MKEKNTYYIMHNGIATITTTNYQKIKAILLNELNIYMDNLYDNDYFYIFYSKNSKIIVKDFYVIAYQQIKKLKITNDIINFCNNDLSY